MNNPKVEGNNYDPHITPAETAAREEREGENFKNLSHENEGDINTSTGYTVDREGLVNNFAVEPEMYYEEPGDLQEKEAAEAAAREQELDTVNQTDETGQLTVEEDNRGKGVGLI